MASISAKGYLTSLMLVLVRKELTTRSVVSRTLSKSQMQTLTSLPECLSFFVGNWQCKHIVLGACHDSSYASFLGKFAADVSTRDRITLLYNNAIHPRIVAPGFKKAVKLDTVFAPRLLVELSTSTAVFTGNGFTNPFTLSERLGPVLRDTEGKRIDKKLKVDVRSGYLNVLWGTSCAMPITCVVDVKAAI